METQKKQFKPQSLRTILATLFVILLLAGGAGFYFGLNIVREYASEVNNRLADADASGEQIDALNTLKQRLAQNTSMIEKADQLFANPNTYQPEVLNDLERYAAASGLSIANTAFADQNDAGVYSVTFTLRQPVAYSNFITFLNNIESNLPKLQVSSIALGRAGSDAKNIRTGDIKIDISVR